MHYNNTSTNKKFKFCQIFKERFAHIVSAHTRLFACTSSTKPLAAATIIIMTMNVFYTGFTFIKSSPCLDNNVCSYLRLYEFNDFFDRLFGVVVVAIVMTTRKGTV